LIKEAKYATEELRYFKKDILSVFTFLCKDWYSRAGGFESGKMYVLSLVFGIKFDNKECQQMFELNESNISNLNNSIARIPEEYKEHIFLYCCYLVDTRGQIQDEERLDYIRKQFAYSEQEGQRIWRSAKALRELKSFMSLFSE